MKQETKAKILDKANKLYTKAVTVGTAAATAVCTTAMSVSAVGEDVSSGGGSSSGLSTALASVDPNVVLDGFYQVLPTVLTIALPIIGAKVALNFLFGSVKGA